MMKIRELSAAIAMLAAIPCAALANGAIIIACAPLPHVDAIYSCDVRNDTQAPIAAIRYTPEVTKKGRTVPFLARESRSRTREIPGGIEPGETMPVTIATGFFPSDSQRDGLIVTFHILAVLDVNGNPITAD